MQCPVTSPRKTISHPCLVLMQGGISKSSPLLMYHSENPQAFKKFKAQKSQLNVMWRSNSKAWVTHILFVEWINKVFGPSVKKYF